MLLSVKNYKIIIIKMSIANELYKLQEIDQELASGEQTCLRIQEELTDNREITTIQEHLEAGKKQLDEYTRQQKTLEWEIDDIATKLSKFEEQLYSGKTSNPKELSGFQLEIENLKEQKEKLEDRDLELMESLEQTNTTVSGFESRLAQLLKTREETQKQLTAELKETKSMISTLQEKRQTLAATFEPYTLTVYETLKKQRGTAVAKIERGICRGCRILLTVNELQEVRSGNLVRCSSCGRILYLDH